MNKGIRERIRVILRKLHEADELLQSALAKEEEVYDNLSEYFPGAEMTERSEDAVERMNEAAEMIGDAISVLEEIKGVGGKGG